MNDKQKICKNCYYWVLGECYVFPPKTHEGRSIRPITEEHDYCSKFLEVEEV